MGIPGHFGKFEIIRDLVLGNAMELFEIGLVDDMENLQATLLVTVTPTLASSGQTVGTICIGQDITKLKDGPRAELKTIVEAMEINMPCQDMRNHGNVRLRNKGGFSVNIWLVVTKNHGILNDFPYIDSVGNNHPN